MRERRLRSPVSHIFVYGSLRSDGDQAALLEQFALRRAGASVRGQIDFDAASFPVASFDPLATTSVDGELVSLDPARTAQALENLDRYEGRDFRRVKVKVGRVKAYAYEWLAAVDDSVAEYLNASRRKIAIARYHVERLREEMDTPPTAREPPIPVQAHFEGALYSAVAASDQLAAAINRAEALDLDRSGLSEVLRDVDLSKPFYRSLAEWDAEPISRDVRELRRRATHHHYEKTPSGPTWIADPVDSTYDGRRDLVSYGAALVQHLERLRDLLRPVERFYLERSGNR